MGLFFTDEIGNSPPAIGWPRSCPGRKHLSVRESITQHG